MAVLLTVLKIIGIVLLSILCLVLLVLIIVLFAPIGYDSEGRYDGEDKPLINVHVYWLLKIIRYRFTLRGKEKEQELKVLFFTLLPKKEEEEKPKKKKQKKETSKTETKDAADKPDESKTEDEKIPDTGPEDREEAFERLEQKISEEIQGDEAAERDEKDETPKKERVSVFKKISDTRDKIKYKFMDICDKIKDGRMKTEDLINKYSDERTRNAVIELWLVLKRLLWHIRPRKFSIYVHYGMEDPSQTGEIFGIYNSFYPIHRGIPIVVPDFDNKCFDGNYTVKGHLQLFFVLTALIRLYFNKDVRRLYDMIKK